MTFSEEHAMRQVEVNLDWTPEEDDFRAEVSEWLDQNVPKEPLPSGDTREGFAEHLKWERNLYEAGYAAVSWPKALGGRDATLWEWLIFEEEYYRHEAPQRVTQNGLFVLAPALFAFGTKEQQQQLLPRIASGEDAWAQGWSEPGSGSDLASLTSTARRDPDREGWLLTGHKTWSTRAAFCTHMFGLFRTSAEEKKHRGLTYFLIDLDQPGVEIKGFDRLDGDEGFADVYLDEVYVPDDSILGGVGEGWKVAMASAGSERGLTLRSPGRFKATASALVDLYQQTTAAAADQPSRQEMASLRDAVVDRWIETEAYDLLTKDQVSRMLAGDEVGFESSITKIAWSELDIALHETALALEANSSLFVNDWTKGFMFSLGGKIYAGTNEVQKNIIAERLLGLPKN